jgi:hypothetical protein
MKKTSGNPGGIAFQYFFLPTTSFLAFVLIFKDFFIFL